MSETEIIEYINKLSIMETELLKSLEKVCAEKSQLWAALLEIRENER